MVLLSEYKNNFSLDRKSEINFFFIIIFKQRTLVNQNMK